jgi:hypothetical protein
MAFDICMLSLSLSLHMHNTWTSQMHNTIAIAMGHTKIVSNNKPYLPTTGGNFGEHNGFLVGTNWEQRNHPKNPNNTHFPQKKNLGLIHVM